MSRRTYSLSVRSTQRGDRTDSRLGSARLGYRASPLYLFRLVALILGLKAAADLVPDYLFAVRVDLPHRLVPGRQARFRSINAMLAHLCGLVGLWW
jgi:hypothetical protein